MAENIHLEDYAKLHLMGDPNNVYKFEKYRVLMLKEYIEEYQQNEENFNKLMDFSIKGNFDIIYEIYLDIVTTLLETEEKYKIGDWFYIEDSYETRQWHGMGRISYDLNTNKKNLVFYGEDTPYGFGGNVNNNVFPKWLRDKIAEKPNFDKYAAEEYIEAIFGNIDN